MLIDTLIKQRGVKYSEALDIYYDNRVPIWAAATAIIGASPRDDGDGLLLWKKVNAAITRLRKKHKQLWYGWYEEGIMLFTVPPAEAHRLAIAKRDARVRKMANKVVFSTTIPPTPIDPNQRYWRLSIHNPYHYHYDDSTESTWNLYIPQGLDISELTKLVPGPHTTPATHQINPANSDWFYFDNASVSLMGPGGTIYPKEVVLKDQAAVDEIVAAIRHWLGRLAAVTKEFADHGLRYNHTTIVTLSRDSTKSSSGPYPVKLREQDLSPKIIKLAKKHGLTQQHREKFVGEVIFLYTAEEAERYLAKDNLGQSETSYGQWRKIADDIWTTVARRTKAPTTSVGKGG